MGVHMADVVMGAQILEYAERISVVIKKLTTASEQARAATDMVNGEGFYEGLAKPELVMFYENYVAHVDKLIMLEWAAMEFLKLVFATFDFTQEELDTLARQLLED